VRVIYILVPYLSVLYHVKLLQSVELGKLIVGCEI
jgi:hypothetical protein